MRIRRATLPRRPDPSDLQARPGSAACIARPRCPSNSPPPAPARRCGGCDGPVAAARAAPGTACAAQAPGGRLHLGGKGLRRCLHGEDGPQARPIGWIAGRPLPSLCHAASGPAGALHALHLPYGEERREHALPTLFAGAVPVPCAFCCCPPSVAEPATQQEHTAGAEPLATRLPLVRRNMWDAAGLSQVAAATTQPPDSSAYLATLDCPAARAAVSPSAAAPRRAPMAAPRIPLAGRNCQWLRPPCPCGCALPWSAAPCCAVPRR